jgi:glycine/D-amino acid oxidase-like deaminating enzyme
LRAASVVVAAGPWAGRFFAVLGLSNELRVTHQQVAYYPVEEAGLWEVGRCPVYIVHGREGFYGFPVSERPGFIKVAVETDIGISDPDELPRTPDRETVEALNEIVRTRFRRGEAGAGGGRDLPLHRDSRP